MTLRQTSAQVSASFVKTLSFLTLPCAVTTDPTRFGHLISFYSANFLIESCQVGWCVHFELKCTPADCFLYDFYRQKFCWFKLQKWSNLDWLFKVRAHKVILAACSPFFRRILAHNADRKNPLLYLKGIQKRELQAILNFMYHGEVRNSKTSLLSNLLWI